MRLKTCRTGQFKLREFVMNINLLSGLVFLAVFTGVVLIHEIGHFIVGRLFKVEVEEFGFGIPPKMLTLFWWRGTEFTLNWLPFGGFNRFKGESDPDVKDGLMDSNPWVRLAIFFAGSAMNLLAGIVVISVIFTQVGLPDFSVSQIRDVTAGSPAALSGIQTDDIILEINGEPINQEGAAHLLIRKNIDTATTFTIQRGDEIFDVVATPDSSRNAQEGALGVSIGPGYAPAKSWFHALPYSVETTFYQARMILMLPVQMITGELSSEEGRFIGFKGIYSIFQQTVDRDVESRSTATTTDGGPTFLTLEMIATLTITLGIFNLLPLPALDGGRILFVIAELIFRRRVPPEYENIIHAVGMMALLGFMVYINLMDFINPVDILLP